MQARVVPGQDFLLSKIQLEDWKKLILFACICALRNNDGDDGAYPVFWGVTFGETHDRNEHLSLDVEKQDLWA